MVALLNSEAQKAKHRVDLTLKTKMIRQSVTFKASPTNVYTAIVDSKKHSEFSGSKSKIDSKVGGVFSAYDACIIGKILELEPGKKIVLSIRMEEEHWPTNHFSTATFLLTKVKNGTKLNFTQTSVPEEHFEDINQGWKDFYWQPIKALLEK